MSMSSLRHPRHRPLVTAAAALVLLPLVLQAIGLTLDTSAVVVIMAIAAMGLNLLVGTTGLVSFGHSVWFGIGGYAVAISQLRWMPGQFVLPLDGHDALGDAADDRRGIT